MCIQIKVNEVNVMNTEVSYITFELIDAWEVFIKKDGKSAKVEIQNFLEKSSGWGLRPKQKFCRTEAESNTSAEAEKKLRPNRSFVRH